LERLINSSLDGILAFDRDLVFTVWNPLWKEFSSRIRQTLGRSAFKACPFLLELGEDVNFAAALRGEKVISRDKSYSTPGTGRQGYFEGYYGPMYDTRGGEVIGGLAIIRDVTERRIAEDGKRISEERYRELFENAYDMVYTHDLAGNITSINKAAERILGYARAEALRIRFSQFVAPEFQQAARRMMDRQTADEAPITCELDVIAKNGSRVTLEVSNRLIFQEGKPVGIQGIARDITERKKTEEALQQANKKLEAWVQELEQRTREMTLLSEMGDILRACLTKEEVYAVIVRVAKEIFPLQAGALFVLGPLRNITEAVAEWGDTSRIELTFSPEECWALRRGRVHWVEDTRIGLLCKHLHEPPPSGYLCVPMMAQSEAVGILHLIQPQDALMPEAKLRLAIAMAEHVAMALSNLRLHETLRSQSIRDQLTGLFNRSFLEESLELELRRAARSQHPCSVIMLALDNFQLLNDSFGLDVGDSVLRKAGMMVQTSVRKGDIACRFSGQTYVVALPQCGYEVGLKRADSLRDLARTLEVKYQSEQVGQITVSIGLAVYPDHGQTVETLLRSAEAALNRARNSGGDCVVVAT
jgi:diguanylate cyclase (GGDEF)-like protein/PAS domain S-box-containing protein